MHEERATGDETIGAIPPAGDAVKFDEESCKAEAGVVEVRTGSAAETMPAEDDAAVAVLESEELLGNRSDTPPQRWDSDERERRVFDPDS